MMITGEFGIFEKLVRSQLTRPIIHLRRIYFIHHKLLILDLICYNCLLLLLRLLFLLYLESTTLVLYCHLTLSPVYSSITPTFLISLAKMFPTSFFVFLSTTSH